MPLAFTSKRRDRLIKSLLEIATRILLRRLGPREFAKTHVGRRLYRLKGRGRRARGESLVKLAKSLTGPVVYAFWKGKHCLYVGKGLKGTRLIAHRKSYGREADCVEVWSVRSRSYLPKAECLATHLFEPKDEAMRPEHRAWGKRCPVCVRHDRIRRELRGLFTMR